MNLVNQFLRETWAVDGLPCAWTHLEEPNDRGDVTCISARSVIHRSSDMTGFLDADARFAQQNLKWNRRVNIAIIDLPDLRMMKNSATRTRETDQNYQT